MTDAKLTIVAGTYNRCDQVQRLVESVERETRIPYILYITDAGSDDGTIEYLQSVASDRVRPIFVGELLGQAKAYNDVFRIVTTPYVCWLSDDNEVVNHGLDTAVSILEADDRIGMVGLKVRDQEGPFVKAPYIGGISTIGILNVNQGVLPTKVLHAVGGFSEEFRDYGIDPDITAKVLFMGRDLVYTRDVAIHHFRNWAEDKDSPEYAKLQAKHTRSLELYKDIYGSHGEPTKVWSLKKRVWELGKKHLSQRINFSMNSQEPILGHIPRDWYNILFSKYVNPIELLTNRSKPYHLRQRYSGPIQIPSDPAMRPAPAAELERAIAPNGAASAAPAPAPVASAATTNGSAPAATFDGAADLAWLARRRPVTAVIDIGANDGAFAAYLAGVFDTKTVHAFEPLEQHHAGLSERGFTVHPYALSDAAGEAAFFVSGADAASSLRSVSDRCVAEYPEASVVAQTTVERRRLDDVLPPIEDALIKVDAQGAEAEILDGGHAVFKAASVVLIEQTFRPLYDGQALFNAVHRRLDDLGFDLIGFRSQKTSAESGEPLFAHAVYERRAN